MASRNTLAGTLLRLAMQRAIARLFEEDQTPRSEYAKDATKIIGHLNEIPFSKVRGMITMVLLEDEAGDGLALDIQASCTPAIGAAMIDFYRMDMAEKEAEAACECENCRARKEATPGDINLEDALHFVFGDSVDLGGIQVFNIGPKR